MNVMLRYLVVFFALLASVIQGYAQQTAAGVFGPSNDLINNAIRPFDPTLYYQEHHLLDSSHVFLKMSDDNSWMLSSKVVFEYDKAGRLTTRSLADMVDTKWLNSEQTVYNYNEADMPLLTLLKTYNVLTKQWDNNGRIHHYYNYSGQENEVIMEEWSHAKWIPSEKIERDFDSDKNLINELTFGWDVSTTDWFPTQRKFFEYDEEMLLTNEIVQVWDISSREWVNEEQEQFFYDTENVLVESILSTWDDEISGFQPQAVTVWDYNEEGMVQEVEQTALNGAPQTALFSQTAGYNIAGKLDELVNEIWNPVTENWEPHSYETHFWNKYLKGNKQPDSEGINCIFANPHSIGLPWHCVNLKQGLEYTIQVYDLYGRVYYSSTFIGGNNFRINTSIPSGMYVVAIQGGLDLHSEKVIIR